MPMNRVEACLMFAGVLLLGAVGMAAEPPDYPMWCQGRAGMARSDGRSLIVEFRAGTAPAGQSLEPGVCSWLDRGFRPGEPTRVIDVRPTPGEAHITAQHINGGAAWTFWVYRTGDHMKAVASYRGKTKNKPVRID